MFSHTLLLSEKSFQNICSICSLSQNIGTQMVTKEQMGADGADGKFVPDGQSIIKKRWNSGNQGAAQQPGIGTLNEETGHFIDKVEGGVGLYIQHDV